MTIYFLSAHTRPSGGTKVLNQMVNLCIEKGIDSRLVVAEDPDSVSSFMSNPCPVISISSFLKRAKPEDVAINCWQQKETHEAMKESPCFTKVFWQHGASIPVYEDFNGEEVFISDVYNQHWNVSSVCAQYIKNKYNLQRISIVYPYFDDETLLKFVDKNEYGKKGILSVRRRGQEIIPHIISGLSKTKITIMPDTFTDEEFYEQLSKHAFFVSTDNGVGNSKLIPTNSQTRVNKLENLISSGKNIINFNKTKNHKKNTWIVPKGNLLGFPMSACEAAWLGCNVIGFAMGGGLEWMSEENMYLADDGNADSLLENINKALFDTRKKHEEKKRKAFKAVQKFNKNETWQQLTSLLNL